MGYVFLLLTVVSEVTGTTMLRLSAGFTKLAPSAVAVACYCATMAFMSLSLKALPMGVVYATWSGLGISLLTLIGVVVFGETFPPVKIVWIALVVVGVIGLNAGRG